MAAGTRLFGCRECDFDICEACCAAAQPTEGLHESRRQDPEAARVSALDSELRHLEAEIRESQQAEERCHESHRALSAALAQVTQYLEKQNDDLPPIDQLMDPTWDKTYGPDGDTHWTGAVKDSHDRGGEPYYCPNGWKRFGVRVPGFEETWSGSNIVYHGTQSGLASDILHAGFKGTTGCYVDKHCGGEQVTYFSPSITYSAHKRYAKVWPRKRDGKTQYYQMVLQCRVKPAAVTYKGGETLLSNSQKKKGTQVDSNFADNKRMEWLVKATQEDAAGNKFVDKDQVLLYGIMVRVTDVHPRELPESSWWSG